jgi:TDG/mug DNA glycosylase family protein
VDQVYSFPPISNSTARILILGSMPGKRSLQMQEYYAHPQNAFWRILAQLLNFDPVLPYPARVQQVQNSGVALWDVMAECERPSSLDSDIVESSIVANDFSAFFSKHPLIRHVFCNGAKSFQSFQRHVRVNLSERNLEIPVTKLPSTSPAHATMNFQAKLEAWSIIQTHAD